MLTCTSLWYPFYVLGIINPYNEFGVQWDCRMRNRPSPELGFMSLVLWMLGIYYPLPTNPVPLARFTGHRDYDRYRPTYLQALGGDHQAYYRPHSSPSSSSASSTTSTFSLKKSSTCSIERHSLSNKFAAYSTTSANLTWGGSIWGAPNPGPAHYPARRFMLYQPDYVIVMVMGPTQSIFIFAETGGRACYCVALASVNLDFLGGAHLRFLSEKSP